MKRAAISIIIILLSLPLAKGQKFAATVDKNKVALGDIIQLSYKLIDANLEAFTPPEFHGVRVVAGPDLSREVISINGKMSYGFTYTYMVQAIAKGKVTIGPAGVKASGKQLQSNSITIQVSQDQDKQADNANKQSIIMLATANKTQAYEGEAIVVTYKVYVSKNINNMQMPPITKMPAFTGFWAEDGTSNTNPVQTEEIYKGSRYITFTRRRLILFPRKPGILEVDPMEIECTGQIIMHQKTDPFDPFDGMFGGLGGESVPFHKVVSSNAIKINVLPVPVQNKPASFTGMVGKAAISASIDTKTTKANEPVVFHVTIGGEGNLSLQQALKLNLPPEIEVYEPKTIDKIDRTSDNLTGTRTFEYTLMPHNAGNYEIPAIKFSYFDPATKKYYESATGAVKLVVDKNDKAVSDTDSERTGIKNSGKGLATYLQVVLLLIICAGLLYLVMRFVRKKEKPVVADGPVEDPFEEIHYNYYLDEAGKLVNHDQHNEFYTVMLNALYRFMEQKLDIPFSEISHESIKEGLTLKNIPASLTESYLRLIDECEMVKFAPAGFSANKEDILKKGKEMISEIEKLD